MFGTCILATCTTNADCPAEVPDCNEAGQCVECLDSSECGDQICNASSQCAACVDDAECQDGGFCIEGHCRTSIVPLLADVCDAEATGDLELTSFNTTTEATNCTQILAQDNGPDICVVRASTVQVAAGSTVSITGERALAVVADGDLIIEGTLDVSANVIRSGPGGGGIESGGVATATTGGGGAGFAGGGGSGGSTSIGGAANSGEAQSNPLAPLRGGARAGGEFGGGGGGALLVISCRGAIRISGLVDAGGGGGRGGAGNQTSIVVGGFGGGAGGTVVLQGVSIEVTGEVFANGGGGGGGAAFNSGAATTRGKNGENGARSTAVPAAGGELDPGVVGGGSGAIGGMSARDGAAVSPPDPPLIPGFGPSGGGGATGFLLTFTPIGRTPDLANATTSPSFGANLVVETK